MSFLQRMPKPTFSAYRYLVRIPSSATYSICCLQRNNSHQRKSLSSVSVCFVPKRNKSISDTLTNIYTSVSHSTTVSYFQNALVSFHDFTGLPWWATIIIYTFGMRLAMFPLAVYGKKMKAQLVSILSTELPAMNDELKREVAMAKKKFNMNDRDTFILYKRSFNTQYRKMIERDNCHPLKTTILFWFQIPIWICHSIGIRNILTMQPDPNSVKALNVFTQMTVGGILWVPNLIESDASYILPMVWGITNLMNIELGALENGGKSTKFMNIMTNIFRGVIIAVIPIGATVPSCLCLYWCTSSLCALGQNLILLSPKAKRTLGIPLDAKHHMDHPYRTIAQRFVEQMQRRKNWCTSLIKSK